MCKYTQLTYKQHKLVESIKEQPPVIFKKSTPLVKTSIDWKTVCQK